MSLGTYKTVQLLAELERRFREATPNEPARVALLMVADACDVPDLDYRQDGER